MRGSYLLPLIVIGAPAWTAVNQEGNSVRIEHRGSYTRPTTTSVSKIASPVVAQQSKAIDQHCFGTERPNLSCEAIAAQAAIDQARHAKLETLIAAVGVLLGTATFIVAVIAAYWAKRAAQHTQESAVEAHAAVIGALAANDLTKQMIATENRAWVAPVGPPSILRITDNISESVYYRFDIAWENYGKSPAFKFRSRSNALVVPMESEVLFPRNIPLESRPSTIVPKQTISLGAYNIDAQDVFDVADKKKRLFLWYFVTYESSYVDMSCETSHCIEVQTMGTSSNLTAENVPAAMFVFHIIGDQCSAS